MMNTAICCCGAHSFFFDVHIFWGHLGTCAMTAFATVSPPFPLLPFSRCLLHVHLSLSLPPALALFTTSLLATSFGQFCLLRSAYPFCGLCRCLLRCFVFIAPIYVCVCVCFKLTVSVRATSNSNNYNNNLCS